MDLGKSGVLPGTQTSFTKTNLLTDGSTIHVTFFFKLAGDPGFTPVDYQYTAFTSEVPPEAAMRADELLGAGDVDGYAVWRRILRAVEEMRRAELGPGVSVQ